MNDRTIILHFIFFNILLLDTHICNTIHHIQQHELLLKIPGVQVTRNDEYIATAFELRELLSNTGVTISRITKFSGILNLRTD